MSVSYRPISDEVRMHASMHMIAIVSSLDLYWGILSFRVWITMKCRILDRIDTPWRRFRGMIGCSNGKAFLINPKDRRSLREQSSPSPCLWFVGLAREASAPQVSRASPFVRGARWEAKDRIRAPDASQGEIKVDKKRSPRPKGFYHSVNKVEVRLLTCTWVLFSSVQICGECAETRLKSAISISSPEVG